MALLRPLLVLLMSLLAASAAADPLQNRSQFGVDMRAGPGLQFPLIHVLDPGEIADRGRCDLDGRWCLLTARDKLGWVDTTGLVAPRSVLSQTAPLGPITTAPVEVQPLDPVPQPAPQPSPTDQAARPLPDVIMDAVRNAPTTPDPAPETLPAPETTLEPIPVPDASPVAPRPGVIIPADATVPFLFATDVPFYNVTDGLVNLRAGPGTDTAVLGELRPGEGGTIELCNRAESWCLLNLAQGGQAWVKMTLVGLRRIAVAPLSER